MTQADTPMPGEDPGALIEDADRLNEIEPGPVDDRAAPRAPGDATPDADEAERQRT